MKLRSLKLGLLIVAAGTMPVEVIAGATAKATVSANIVPMVTASMTGTSMMTQTIDEMSESGSVIELNNLKAKNVARFILSSHQNITYSITVSSIDVSNSQGNKLAADSFRIPVKNVYMTSGRVHELRMKAVLDGSQGIDQGPYYGMVNLTANFN